MVLSYDIKKLSLPPTTGLKAAVTKLKNHLDACDQELSAVENEIAQVVHINQELSTGTSSVSDITAFLQLMEKRDADQTASMSELTEKQKLIHNFKLNKAAVLISALNENLEDYLFKLLDIWHQYEEAMCLANWDDSKAIAIHIQGTYRAIHTDYMTQYRRCDWVNGQAPDGTLVEKANNLNIPAATLTAGNKMMVEDILKGGANNYTFTEAFGTIDSKQEEM